MLGEVGAGVEGGVRGCGGEVGGEEGEGLGGGEGGAGVVDAGRVGGGHCAGLKGFPVRGWVGLWMCGGCTLVFFSCFAAGCGDGCEGGRGWKVRFLGRSLLAQLMAAFWVVTDSKSGNHKSILPGPTRESSVL